MTFVMDESRCSFAERPRLLVLASTYPRWHEDPEPGFVHELSKRLAQHFDVTVLSPHALGALPFERMDGVDVFRYRYAPARLETLVQGGGVTANLRRSKWKALLVPTFLLAQLLAAWRLTRSRQIDVIHAHWLIPQGLTSAILHVITRRAIPFVVTSHGADLYALKGKLLQAIKLFVLRHARANTVVSDSMYEHLHAMGVDMSKASISPMGVDLLGMFTPDASTPRSNHEILFAGRLVEKKGLTHLLDAMPEVIRQCPDASLIIAGFGPERERLESQAQALGLAEKVSFLGPVPQAELPGLYRRAALFVAPFVRASSGDEEGLGLVTVEAIGCGCPVLVGNVPAVRDVLGEEFTSLSVDPRDTTRLAQKILMTLSPQQSSYSSCVNLRANVVTKFDWNSVADRYARLLMQATPSEDAPPTPGSRN